MKPINSNLKLKPEDGCTKTSSSCVIWQGPDIPCIELCKGDSITDVVYELAMKLCEITSGVIDLSTLDFKCLVPTGIAEPTTIIQALQLLIDKQCFFEDNCCDDGSGGGTVPIPISLPPCLYFTEDGDQITALLPTDYSSYLASKICEIIDDITSINSTIGSLQGRVSALEASSGGGGGTGTTISIVAQCASNPIPGTVVPIGQAFSAFESKFCQLTTLLGSNAALSTAIAKECTGLDAAPQLTTPANTMSQLAGWVATPTNLSETIVNMWLTICDMRTAIVNSSNTTLPCVPVSVSNIQITSLTSTGSIITWSAPNTGSMSEAPSQYILQVYEWNGSATVGSPIVNVVKPFGTNTHTITAVPDATKNYQIQISAEYTCDVSTVATIVGKLALTSVEYCVEVTDIAAADVTTTCGGETYTDHQRTTTVTLKNISTGAIASNSGAAITVTLSYDNTGDCVPLTSTRDFIIGTGVASSTYTYYSQRTKKCSPAEPCTTETKEYTCVASINTDRAVVCPGVVEC